MASNIQSLFFSKSRQLSSPLDHIPARLRGPIVRTILATERVVARRRLRRNQSFHSPGEPNYGVVAFYGKANGLTRGAQLQVEAMTQSGIPASPVDASSSTPVSLSDFSDPLNLVLHAGAPESARLLNSISFAGRSINPIGYWAWELPNPPQDWKACESLVSEIWTPSNYSAMSLKQLFDIPVKVVPHRIQAQVPRRRDVDGKFTVLTMADSRSSFTRKNPAASVEAFRNAFEDRDDVQLIVKLLGKSNDIETFKESLRDVPNVRFETNLLGLPALQQLYRSADVLLSLHRAEGFGLPMLEAMAHGVPAIATGWSGNVDFMSDGDSILVPYLMVETQDQSGIYNVPSEWAEPDKDFAALALRRLQSDIAYYNRMSAAAHAKVLSQKPFSVPR